jgi:hypothetical protein
MNIIPRNVTEIFGRCARVIYSNGYVCLSVHLSILLSVSKARKILIKFDNELHGTEPFLRSLQSLSYVRISLHFVEPEGSLPCTQKPATDPYPEPD